MPYYLKVLAGVFPADQGRKIPLKEGETTLGRLAPPCDFALDGKKVSKRHCVFRQEGGTLRVDDLQSANGLYVNGKQVPSANLKARDRLVVGEFTLEVTEG